MLDTRRQLPERYPVREQLKRALARTADFRTLSYPKSLLQPSLQLHDSVQCREESLPCPKSDDFGAASPGALFHEFRSAVLRFVRVMKLSRL